MQTFAATLHPLWCMWKCAAALVIVCVVFGGCTHQKKLTTEDVRSALTSAVSLASDAELFISRMQAGATTPAFDSGHAEYLQQEIDDALKEFSGKQPDPNAQGATAQCRDGLIQLKSEVSQLSHANREELEAARARVDAVRDALLQAKASL